jgi:hypothetical protein
MSNDTLTFGGNATFAEGNVTFNNNVGINTATPQARLDVAGTIRVGNGGEACDSNRTGAIRWNGTVFQGCNGTSWTELGGGPQVPSGAIMAFDLSTCPSGWSEYTQARGRFLRGIDNGAGVDPSGTRAVGNVQHDAIQNITGGFKVAGGDGGIDGTSGAFTVVNSPQRFAVNDPSTFPGVGQASFNASRVVRTANETRPVNVAVLFCRRN